MKIFKLGRYKGQELEWMLISELKNSYYAITSNVIDIVPYSDDEGTIYDYFRENANRYLYGKYTQEFTKEEKDCILDKYVTIPGNVGDVSSKIAYPSDYLEGEKYNLQTAGRNSESIYVKTYKHVVKKNFGCPYWLPNGNVIGPAGEKSKLDEENKMCGLRLAIYISKSTNLEFEEYDSKLTFDKLKFAIDYYDSYSEFQKTDITIPDEILNDKEKCIELMNINADVFINAVGKRKIKEIFQDKEIIKNALLTNIYALNTSGSFLIGKNEVSSLRSDVRLMTEAIKKTRSYSDNGNLTIEAAIDISPSDYTKELVYESLRFDVSLYKKCSDEIKNDKDIALATVYLSPINFQYLPEDLKKDKKIIMDLINKYPNIYLELSGELYLDRDVILLAIKNGVDIAKLTPNAYGKIKDERDLIIKSVACGASKLREEFKNDKDILAAYAKRMMFFEPECCKKFLGDRDFVMQLIDYGCTEVIKYMSDELKKDKSIYIAAAKKSSYIDRFPLKCKNDIDIMIPILKNNIEAVKYFDKRLIMALINKGYEIYQKNPEEFEEVLKDFKD